MTLLRNSLLLVLMALISACQTSSMDDRQSYIDSVIEQDSIREIMDLQVRYMRFYDQVENRNVDRPDNDFIVDQIFTHNGVWIAKSGGSQSTYRGKEELVKMFQEVANRHSQDSEHFVKHFSLNPKITVKGTVASNREEFLVFHSSGLHKESYWIIGHYIDEYQKDDNGKWRIASKTAHIADVTKWPSVRMVGDSSE